MLRGPGSVPYGSGAIGGVIALRTIEPDDILAPGSEHPVGGFPRGGYQSQGGMWRGSGAGAVRLGDFAGLFAASFGASNRAAPTALLDAFTAVTPKLARSPMIETLRDPPCRTHRTAQTVSGASPLRALRLKHERGARRRRATASCCSPAGNPLERPRLGRAPASSRRVSGP